MDHRELIALYDLGHIEEHSPGLIHWHAPGVRVLRKLEDYVRLLHEEKGYMEVRSPALLSKSLWEKSGHWDKYQDLMYVAEGGEVPMAVKPMSCPGHIAIYQEKKRSYRELPFRQFEFGHVHRREMSGSLSGWLRLRGFVQDDSHVLCAKDQIKDVIQDFVSMVEKAYKDFGFDIWAWKISLRPEKRAGSDDVWDEAESALRAACVSMGIKAKEVPGDGAFYGPKLEVVLKDRLGRDWQCGVAQVDFVLPSRFDLEYDASNGKDSPVMIHHAILGSLERWLSVVMEHHGELPKWLSPHEVAVLPVSQAQLDYAKELVSVLKREGVRADLLLDGPLGGRVRSAGMLKYAHQVVVGDKEKESGSVSVGQKGQMKQVALSDWAKIVAKDLKAP